MFNVSKKSRIVERATKKATYQKSLTMAAFSLLYFVRRPIPVPFLSKRCPILMGMQ
jgi:hypothetical protein